MKSHLYWLKQSLPRRLHAAALIFLAATLGASAQVTNTPTQEELKQLSLEELMNLEVTMVARRPEKLYESPSAAQVITGEEIRRSGATTLPEALRLAPNLQVARQNAHDWGITARGFNAAPFENNTLANKLLVMIDGRTVYTPLFGGVFWDVQNVLLEDIDRIEIISGPGGTLWGANAVNGIINVVSKSSRETQGFYLSGAGGSFLQDFAALRYGGTASTNLYYRAYVQHFDFNDTKLPTGVRMNDEWGMTQGGLRFDWYPNDDNTVTFQGDIYSGAEGSPRFSNVDGQNVLGRWTRTFSEQSAIILQAYVDRTWRRLPGSGFSDEMLTYDLDLQHRFAIGERHSLVWGAGYRLMQNDVNSFPEFQVFPARRNMQLFSAFLQDEITLIPDRWRLTLGTKLEHNDFSGFELQPSGKLAWTPTERHTIWGAISRAVRSPSRLDADLWTPTVSGNPDFDSEKVTVYELGYRVRPLPRLSLSLAAFYNNYEDVRSFNLNPAVLPPLILANNQEAETWGVELSANFQVTDWWRLRAGYTFLEEDIDATSITVFPGSQGFEAIDPHHKVVLHSIMDLPGHFQLDTLIRYVDRLPTTAVTTQIPDYITLDVRLAWHYKQFEFSVVGQNLWDDYHAEFGTAEIPRSVYGKVTWRF